MTKHSQLDILSSYHSMMHAPMVHSPYAAGPTGRILEQGAPTEGDHPHQPAVATQLTLLHPSLLPRKLRWLLPHPVAAAALCVGPEMFDPSLEAAVSPNQAPGRRQASPRPGLPEGCQRWWATLLQQLLTGQ
jgi:hypothetical protein